MNFTDNFRDIIKRQKDVLSDLETEYHYLESSNLVRENDELKNELQKMNEKYASTKLKENQLAKENISLKNALYQQIYNEKLSILKIFEQKADIYFKSNYEGKMNRLAELEYKVRNRIDNMTEELQKNHIDLKDELYLKLDELSILFNEKLTVLKEESNKKTGVFSENERKEYESLKNEQISDNMIKESAKKNNLESFVGLNIINKLGILLIIIGVIVLSQYTYFKLSPVLKGIMMFGLGAVMLVTGELLSRKKANIFSIGITAGGVSVLYVALATSYFGLKILTMYPAILLCVLITAASFILATRYHAQVILAFALIGGYLPMFSIATGKQILFGAMIYFVVLNFLALLISFHKKWTITTFIGLLLNIVGTIYICSNVKYNAKFAIQFITLSYILFAFLVYTMIPIVSTFTQKMKFKNSDVVLLGLNTFFSSVIMYYYFYYFNLEDYTGILAVAFAVIYILLGKFIETKFQHEKNAKALFYLTGLSFVVLIIPFQFGKAWLTLGWLAEGVALASYGILKNEKGIKRAGFFIDGLCLAAFIIVDVMGEIDYLFAYKYFAITLGSLILLGSYIYKKTLSTRFEIIYKNIVILNLWIYSIYVITEELRKLLHFEKYNDFYLCNALAIVVTFLIALIIPRIRILCDRGTKFLSVFISIIGILWLTILNSLYTAIKGSFVDAPISYFIMGTGILLIISLLSVFALYDLMKCVTMEGKIGVEWFPIIVSGYFVFILTQNLIIQYDLRFSNAVISIIYVLTALIWIIFGFAKRYAFLRRFGLGLSVLAVVKLFIIDLSFLTKGYQIISYFALGITLIAISFVYQYFSKQLEFNVEVIPNDEENN